MKRFLNVFGLRVPAPAAAAGVLAPAIAAISIGVPQGAPPAAGGDAARQPTLEETRLTLAKWIETQQIIAKERNDWQQGKEILQGRIDLVGKEVGVLKERIRQSEEAVAQSDRKRDELLAQDAELKTLGEQLATAATVMEDQIRGLVKQLPDPVKGRIAPLLERIPADPAATRITPAERFQNILGVLNEVNKANSEISVAYEIRTLADGSSSEVQVIYLGLAQAYFLSPKGEAGIGRPTEDGWKWEPAPGAANQILLALEVIQGKHVPTFVPLPIKIR
jgi:hypothetical protein